MKHTIGSTALALLVCSLARCAWASNAVMCVANDSQLAIALSNAETTPVTIEVVQGTYDLRNTVWHLGYTGSHPTHFVAGSQLLGGYTANCSGRAIAVNNTVMTDSSANPRDGVLADGDVTIEGLTFTGMEDLYLSMDTNAFGATGVVASGTTVAIRRNAFVNAQFGGFILRWGQPDDVGGTIRLVDNLIAGNTNLCSLTIDVINGSPQVVWINNTIAANIAVNPDPTGACFTNHSGVDGSGYSGSGVLYAYNNIFWGNDNKDFFSDSSSLVLVDNTIGTSSYPTPDTPPSGTLTSDPKLKTNYHLTEVPLSPAINSGDDDVPGGLPVHDLDGGPRVVGTTVDRGAYESSINDAFIQTVTNTNDSGTGSLRAAIAGANANGALIGFDLGPDCGPHVITLASPLPDITAPVYINGYTQTGAAPNDLDVGDDAAICVILEAGASVDHAIGTASNASASVQVTIKGLAFSGFTRGIDLQGGGGHEIAGNHFGGKVSGYTLTPNATDIRLGSATHDVIVGGDDNANRNIIGDATNNGILLQGGVVNAIAIGSNNDQVLNNYIGVGWSQTGNSYTDRANLGPGIHVQGPNNLISGNLIGSNTGAGILFDGGAASGNVADGNFIGADADGQNLGNGGDGVRFAGSSGDAPGNNIVRNGTIADNGNAGVGVEIGHGNKIRKNSIYANSGLGIDLAGTGVTPNDDDGGFQVADYANHGLNFPVLTAAIGGTNQGTVSGTLTTLSGDYTIDFYTNSACDASGHGEGQIWLRSMTVTVPTPAIGDQGTVTFSATIAYPLLGGRVITATATNAAGDTSEFSACISYTDDTIFADGFDSPT